MTCRLLDLQVPGQSGSGNGNFNAMGGGNGNNNTNNIQVRPERLELYGTLGICGRAGTLVV